MNVGSSTNRILEVGGEGLLIRFDDQGFIREFVFEERSLRPPSICSLFELDGEAGKACPSSQKAGSGLVFQVATGGATGSMSVTGGKEISIQWDGAEVERVGLALQLPVDSVFHLAESRNIGRRIDSEMPVGQSYDSRLSYNMLLVHTDGIWLRWRTNDRIQSTAEVLLARHPEMFTFTFSWRADTKAFLTAFSSMEEALADFTDCIEREFQLVKLADRGLPDWIFNTKLVLTADMLRSNWEITHDYRDVLKLSRDLRKAGCPKDTLFYLPGWHGAYDSTHPTYRPREELGGAGAFRQMVEGLHEDGFRVMIHTTGWGIDPFHADIDRLSKLVCRDEDGDYEAWQLNRKGNPPKVPLKFRTGKIPLSAPRDSRSFTFETPMIPATCEALFTLGGLKGCENRIRLVLDRRSVATPDGWYRKDDEFSFPFPLLLASGINQISVELMGKGQPNWSDAWYRIDYCFVPRSPYTSWTWPILRADTTNPEYIEIFVESVRSVVQEFGIDAVHVDATFFFFRGKNNTKLLRALREGLPGIPICGEAILSFDGLGYWAFSQGARQSMVGYLDPRRIPREQGSLSLEKGLDEVFSWLNKTSPVCGFVKDYARVYPHLCAANAFVPVGKVCNTFPPRLTPRSREELWKVLREARRLDYIPGLRVNYRKYGLDSDTKRAVREIPR